MTDVKGFIPVCTDLITKHIPTPREWAENIAIAVLSTATGSEKVIRTDIGELQMNVWFLMIGPSGIAYKTTPLKYFAFPILSKLTEHIGYSTILPKDYSKEGFIEYLSKVCSQGAMVRDEFTTIFKQSRKDYLADNLEFLSELYDGTMQKRFTRKTKLEQATSVYVTFLSATTPYLYTIMRPQFFIQGTGNRILFTNYDSLEHKEAKMDPSDEEMFNDYLALIRKETYIQKEEKINQFAENLAGVHNSPIKYLTFGQEAAKMYLRYRIEKLHHAKELYKKDKYGILGSYVVRLPEFAVKLAGLARLSSMWIGMAESRLDEIAIVEEDMIWAINKTNRHYEHFQAMVTEWRKKGRTRPYKTDEETKDEALRIITEHGGRILWTELSRELGIFGNDFSKLMDGYAGAGLITWKVEEEEGKRGRKPRYVYLKRINQQSN